MSHPPIPPGCPYFKLADSGRWYFVFPNGEAANNNYTDILLAELGFTCDVDKEQRPVIAAVARCAWLDEAEKVEAAYDENGVIIRTGLCNSQARKNAAAWAAWGRGEKWE